ncbi:MAG: PrsW family glutamic-type intramembrane protease [Thermoplasmata archaeon]|nr:PrsW family glutamic-type intramembrane protease [Thermoplasmata archaeon]
MSFLPNIRPKHILTALGLGAVSTMIASWSSLALMLQTYPAIIPVESPDPNILTLLTAVIVAPFIEELSKPIGLYLLRAEEKPELELREWAFLGAMAGLGFAVVENFLYAATMLSYGTEASVWLLGLRFLLPLHMIATAISGYGIGLWMKTGKGRYFVWCMIISMLLHGAFNLAASVVG